MKSLLKRLIRLRAVQAVLFLTVAVAGVGGAYLYATSHGLVSGAGSGPSATWLTDTNVASQLSISQSSTGSLTAAPAQPVLLVECPPETCDALNLGAVIQKFSGKVTVVAIDPYQQKTITEAIEQSFVLPSIQQEVGFKLAEQVAQSQSKTGSISTADVQAVEQNTQFQQEVQQVLSSSTAFEQADPQDYSLLQPVYPKFFLFSKGNFQLMGAATGVDVNTTAQIESFVSSMLNPPANSSTGTSSSTTGGSTSSSSGTTATSSKPASSASSGKGAGK